MYAFQFTCKHTADRCYIFCAMGFTSFRTSKVTCRLCTERQSNLFGISIKCWCNWNNDGLTWRQPERPAQHIYKHIDVSSTLSIVQTISKSHAVHADQSWAQTSSSFMH